MLTLVFTRRSSGRMQSRAALSWDAWKFLSRTVGRWSSAKRIFRSVIVEPSRHASVKCESLLLTSGLSRAAAEAGEWIAELVAAATGRGW